jgi:hypothetical protein
MPAPDRWALAQPVTWDAPDLKVTIPDGFVTDLASIPRIFRNILDVDGVSRFAAILHDALYCCQQTTRAFADSQLRAALIAYGESRFTAGIYFAGVRAGGWMPWDDRQRRGGGIQADDFITPESYQRYLASGAKFVISQKTL